jgi:hypothetical protein
MRPLAGLAAALGVAAIGLLGVGPPGAVDAGVAAQEFSSERALEELRVIASEPHPAGGPGAARVRDHLGERLAALGLTVELQSWKPQVAWGEVIPDGFMPKRDEPSRLVFFAETPTFHWVPDLTNVIARLPGAQSSGVVLFVCHFDAVPGSFGAGDDGAAAAAFLEAIRALRTGPRPRNDLVFLFTDGEELGLLGAQQFAREHPLFADVRVVFNFEGRGVGGPAILFETGARNGRLVAEYARCAPHPFGSSLGPTVYDAMPNDTDFTPFKAGGVPGLNFAFIGGGSAYHQPSDRIENLSEGSLQHHGTNVLALARHFGELPLEELDAEPDATFMTLPGNVFLHYPGRWNTPLAGLGIVLVLAVLVREHRAARLSWLGLAAGSLTALLGVVFLTLASAGVAWLAAAAHAAIEASASDAHGNLLSSRFGLLAVGAWTLGLAALAARRLGERRAIAVTAGGLLVWSALLAVSAAIATGASHVFAWPTVLGALALACAAESSGAQRVSGRLFLIAAAAVILPVAALLHAVGSAYPSWVAAALAALVLALFALPCLCWLERTTRPASRLAWILPTTLGALLFAVAEVV